MEETAKPAPQEFTVTLNLDELNVVFSLLQEGPFKIVKPIMDKIQQQVQQQATPNTPQETTNEV